MHSPRKGKCAQSESEYDRSSLREETLDVCLHDSKPIDGTGPVEDSGLVLDPPELEPPVSPQDAMPDFEWRANTPPLKHDNSPSPSSWQDPQAKDSQGSQHTPNPDNVSKSGDELEDN